MPVAFAKRAGEVTDAELAGYLAEQLADFVRLEAFEFLEEFPATSASARWFPMNPAPRHQIRLSP